MILLAFDLATVTGVAVGPADGAPVAHSERLSEPGDPLAARFCQALHMTSGLIKQHRPDVIVIESPIVSGAKGGEERARSAIGLFGAVMGMAHQRQVRCVDFKVQSIRKHFVGQGNIASAKAKRAVMTRCRQLGWKVADDNQGDACALWEYGRARLARRMAEPELFDRQR